MVRKDWTILVKDKTKKYSKAQILFTKTKLIDWLCQRNNSTVDMMAGEILLCKDVVFCEKQEVAFEGEKEERFRCYFVYSHNKGRCYVLRFNNVIKVITAFPLGRTTLKRYRKKFK